jgi:hypothetical protein
LQRPPPGRYRLNIRSIFSPGAFRRAPLAARTPPDPLIRRLTIGFCLVALLLGAIQAWIGRFEINPDGISYLDNAAAYLHRDFHNALNTLWSPLYPWLIGALTAIVQPTREQELPLVHLLNFILYAISLAAFLYFLRSIRPFVPARSLAAFLVLSYSAFLFCSLDYTSLAFVTPDLLVNIFAFLVAAQLVRIARSEAPARYFGMFGATLGFGYLAKAPFLPIGIACLLMAAWFARKRALWALLTSLAIAGPYIWALSLNRGRFTFGDSTWINIAIHVDGLPYRNWQGELAGSGRPVHPTRQLSLHPPIFEFATPIAGTYPPWYDPAYWNEGVRITHRLRDFVGPVYEQIRLYAYYVHRQAPLLFAFLVLFLLASDKRETLSRFKTLWPVLALGALPFAMYAPVHAEARYLAPFFVLLWTGLFCGVLEDRRVSLALGAIAAALMLVDPLGAIFVESTHLPQTRLHYEIAHDLQELHLKPGDRVAIVHDDSLYFYWAQLAGVRVTLEVYFSSNRSTRQAEWAVAQRILASQPAAFLVSAALDGVTDQPGWCRLGTTNVFAYPIRPPRTD